MAAAFASTSFAAVAQRGTTCIAGEGADLTFPKASGYYLPALTALTGVSPRNPDYAKLSSWSVYRRWPGGIDLKLPFVVHGGAQMGRYYGVSLPSGWTIGSDYTSPSTWGLLQATSPVGGTYEYWIVYQDQEFSTWVWHCQTVVTTANDASDDAWFAFVDSARAGNAGNDGTRDAAWGTLGEAYANVTTVNANYATNSNYAVPITPSTKKTVVILDSATYASPDDSGSGSATITRLGPDKWMNIIGASGTSRPTITVTSNLLAWNVTGTVDVALMNIIADGDNAAPTDHGQIYAPEVHGGRLIFNCKSTNCDTGAAAANVTSFGTSNNPTSSTVNPQRCWVAWVNCELTVDATTANSRNFVGLEFICRFLVYQNLTINGSPNYLAAGIYLKHSSKHVTFRWLTLTGAASQPIDFNPAGSNVYESVCWQDVYFEFCRLAASAAGSTLGRFQTNNSTCGTLTFRRCSLYGVFSQASGASGSATLKHSNNAIVNSTPAGFTVTGVVVDDAGTGSDADIVQNSAANTILNTGTMEIEAAWEAANPTLVDRIGATVKAAA